MQNPTHRVIGMFAALLASSALLAACSSNGPAPSPTTVTATVTKTAVPGPSVMAVKLQPSDGKVFGVVASGKSWFDYPRDYASQHTTYTCDQGLSTIGLAINAVSKYEGTTVTLTQNGVSSIDKQGSSLYFQYGVTISLKGNLNQFRSHSISLIVTSALKGSSAHPDDAAINLGSGTLGDANAIQLDGTNYNATNITGVKLCMLH